VREAVVITDGSADNIKGTGGWAAIVMVGSILIEKTGHEEPTTSNRMELLAAIEGLKELDLPHNVKLISDSAYMLSALQNKWYERWFLEERPRPNLDLWKVLAGLIHYHDVDFIKIKGHSGDY
jgi:ribonuclease HI